MSSSENLLKGIECPRCGNDERFTIAATVWLDLTDDGTVPSEAPGRGDHEWDHDSVMECPKCGYISRYGAFRVNSPQGHVRSQAT